MGDRARGHGDTGCTSCTAGPASPSWILPSPGQDVQDEPMWYQSWLPMLVIIPVTHPSYHPGYPARYHPESRLSHCRRRAHPPGGDPCVIPGEGRCLTVPIHDADPTITDWSRNGFSELHTNFSHAFFQMGTLPFFKLFTRSHLLELIADFPLCCLKKPANTVTRL